MSYINSQIINVFVLAVVLYFVRIGGFFIAKHLYFNSFVKNWLEYLPGCVMLSIVSPLALNPSFTEWPASVLVVIIMYKTNNLFLAMLSGSLLVITIHLIEGIPAYV